MKRALLTLAFCGCVNDDIVLYETRVRGTVTAMAVGTLHLEFHHETSFGEGALAHPLGLFDRRVRTVSKSPYSLDETVLYPQQQGEGLVVYGWLDRLCVRGQRNVITFTSPTRGASLYFFFFNDTATTEIYTRSLVGSVRCV